MSSSRAGICACIKTSKFTAAINTTDPTWNSYSLYLWTFLEVPLVIIAACIPPSTPIWDFLIKGQPIKLSTSSSYTADSTTSFRIGFIKTSVHARSKTSKNGPVDDGHKLLHGEGAAQSIQQTVLITQTSDERPSPRGSSTNFSPV